MTTITECLHRANQLIESDSPRLDIEVLLAHVLEKGRTWLYTWPEKELSAHQQSQFDLLFNRRLNGEPVAHLTGEKEFWSLPLQVNASTLIPRPETELLVETALSLSLPESARALDLGTGTGAIALALASEKPEWTIVAVDKSPEAVALATKNVADLSVDNVAVFESDWFDSLGDQAGCQRFDLIVSNPPYIDPEDKHLQQGDVRFEPNSALVSANQGYADIEKIIASAQQHLLPSGWLLIEHGFQQASKVRQLMLDKGFLAVKTVKDLSGHERITISQAL